METPITDNSYIEDRMIIRKVLEDHISNYDLMGTDIYTVSKLLGHSELKTTQIYADIIDEQRKLAMHKIPDIGI